MNVNFVLNYGRVGSIGIVEALNQADCGSVLHIHKANPREIGFELVNHLVSGTPVPDDLLWSAAAARIRDSNTLINVICPIREPLTRDISALTYGKDNVPAYLASSNFTNDFYARNVSFGTDWLLSHLVPFTGIDIFSKPFNADLGYQILSRNNIRVLLLQAELDNKAKGLALQNFLCLEQPPVICNKINSSGYSDDQLMSAGTQLLTGKAPRVKTDHVLATHFYNETQVQAALNRLGISLQHVALPNPFRPEGYTLSRT